MRPWIAARRRASGWTVLGGWAVLGASLLTTGLAAAEAATAPPEPARLFLGSEVYWPRLTPSNRWIGNFNTTTGAGFADWDRQFKGRAGLLWVQPVGHGYRLGLGFAASPWHGHVGGDQVVGPASVVLNWKSRNYQLVLQGERQFSATPDLAFGLQGLATYVDSHVFTSVTAGAVVNGGDTRFREVAFGWGPYLAWTGRALGHPLRLQLGYRFQPFAGAAKGTVVVNGTTTSWRSHESENFSGPYVSLMSAF